MTEFLERHRESYFAHARLQLAGLNRQLARMGQGDKLSREALLAQNDVLRKVVRHQQFFLHVLMSTTPQGEDD